MTETAEKNTTNETTPAQPQNEQWQPKKKSTGKRLLVLALLLSGVAGILYAYQLSPFSPNYVETNNAYVRGKATQVSPKVAGYVKEILVQDYQWVEQGQPLVQIETDPFEMKLAQAIAQKENAQQEIANVGVNEQSNLVAIDSAKAGLALAELELSYTQIHAPISGRLGEINVKQGQLVSVGANLMTVVPNDHWLIANVKETEIAQIGIGQPARIEVDALGGRQVLTGKVVQIAPATGSEFSSNKTDPSSGNFIKIAQRIPVKIAFDPKQEALKNISMGMSATVQIDKVKP